MILKNRGVELLAPGGSVSSIKAAVSSGADAVYVGGNSFSARANANNLTDNELIDILEYLHLRNKKLYLAINTLIKDSELKSLFDYAVKMYENGVDAFIVQDFGAMSFLNKYLPEAEIHLSTQMAISGSEAIRLIKSHTNISRVILPRELSLKQIEDISTNTDVDIECFAQGALCYSYSGVCLMSSLICERSGNRGRCAQSCRLPYTYNGSNVEYPLSMKELSTIDILPLMINAGVSSFKLEGRMRKEAYVGAVTGIYRKYLDRAYKISSDERKKDRYKEFYYIEKEDKGLLDKIFNRSGSTKLYFMSKDLIERNKEAMISLNNSSASFNEQLAGEIYHRYKHYLEPLKISATFKLYPYEKPVLILEALINKRTVRVVVSGADIGEAARNHGLNYDSIYKQIKKSDDDFLVLDKLIVDIKEPVFMPISSINALRRDGFKALKAEIIKMNGFNDSRKALAIHNDKAFNYETSSQSKSYAVSLYVYIQSLKLLDTVLSKNFVKRLYIEADELLRLSIDEIGDIVQRVHDVGKEIYLATPHLLEEGYDRFQLLGLDDACFDGYLVRNIEGLALFMQTKKPIVSDYLIYGFNKAAISYLKELNVQSQSLSVELNYHQIVKLLEKEEDLESFELTVYGAVIAMVSKNCVKRTHGCCDSNSSITVLKDRKGYDFAVKSNCTGCYNVIYNSKRLYLADLNDKLKKTGLCNFRVDFLDEDIKSAENILDSVWLSLNDILKTTLLSDYSRGHFNRGVI